MKIVTPTRAELAEKTPFDSFLCANSVSEPTQILYEVSQYNMISLECITRTQKEFIEGDFLSRSSDWQNKRFPNPFSVAARVFATPMSSAASKRVFSTLKLFVDENRSS